MNPYRVTLVRSPLPLQTVEARRPVVSWWVVAVAAVGGIWFLAARCAGKAEAKAAEAPHSLCKWPAENCSSQPPGLGVHFLRDLRAERIARAP